MSEATFPPESQNRLSERLRCFPTNISSQNNFGLLRLALAVLVVFSHSFKVLLLSGHDTLNKVTHGQHDLGDLAVDCFFTISGFLIANSWIQTGNLFLYLKKRALRIFPGLVAAVLFCILLVGPLVSTHLNIYFLDTQTYRFAQILLLKDVFSVDALPGVFHTNPIPDWVDGSLWTIRYEVLCYLLIPLIAWCGLLRRRCLLLTLFLSLLTIFHHYVAGFDVAALAHGYAPGTSSLMGLPRLMLFFLAGITFYTWRDSIPRSPLLLISALVALVLSHGHDLRSERLNLVLPLAGPYILFYLVYSKPIIPFLSRIAQKHDLSYGVYLFGFPIQQLLVHYALIGRVYALTPFSLFGASLSLTLGLALISWKYVERPFLRMKTAKRTHEGAEMLLEPTRVAREVPMTAHLL